MLIVELNAKGSSAGRYGGIHTCRSLSHKKCFSTSTPPKRPLLQTPLTYLYCKCRPIFLPKNNFDGINIDYNYDKTDSNYKICLLTMMTFDEACIEHV